MKIKLMIAVIAIFWLGMIFAIGMESIVKFSTPTLTKAVGFDVGRTVFSAFNHVQLGLLALLVIAGLFAHVKVTDVSIIAVLAVIIAIQIFWLFPALSQRVDIILAGMKPLPTYQHGLYGGLEIGKIILLMLLAGRSII
jgi:hypothetical protein